MFIEEEVNALKERVRALEEAKEAPVRTEWITFAQAREEYHVSETTIYRKISKGLLSLHGIGGKSLLKRSEVEALIIKIPPRPARYVPEKKGKG